MPDTLKKNVVGGGGRPVCLCITCNPIHSLLWGITNFLHEAFLSTTATTIIVVAVTNTPESFSSSLLDHDGPQSTDPGLSRS